MQEKILLFLGARDIAMFLGAIVAMGVATRTMDRAAIARSVGTAISSAGIILLITAVGGSFGAVLQASGIGKIFGTTLGAQISPLLAILLAWGIAAGIKAAQGSGTVAIITTSQLMAPIAPYIALNPLWLAVAIGSGGLLGCHVNDSGFWVVAKTGGLSVRGGLKVYTVSTAINAITTLIFLLLFQAFLFR
ncbi:MAG: Na+/H+ antiporter NhaC family protein [Candidatus Bathyarchaeia archaeon]